MWAAASVVGKWWGRNFSNFRAPKTYLKGACKTSKFLIFSQMGPSVFSWLKGPWWELINKLPPIYYHEQEAIHFFYRSHIHVNSWLRKPWWPSAPFPIFHVDLSYPLSTFTAEHLGMLAHADEWHPRGGETRCSPYYQTHSFCLYHFL